MNGWMDGWIGRLSTRNAFHSTVIDDPAGTSLGLSSPPTGFGFRFRFRVLFSCQIIRCMLPLCRFWLKWHDIRAQTNRHMHGVCWFELSISCSSCPSGCSSIWSAKKRTLPRRLSALFAPPPFFAGFRMRVLVKGFITAPVPRLPAICLAA